MLIASRPIEEYSAFRYWCRFAGDRYAPPLDTPDMMLLYDTEGNVAGMQSVVPQEELQFTCDGTVNDFYVLDVINGMNVSSTTTT